MAALAQTRLHCNAPYAGASRHTNQSPTGDHTSSSATHVNNENRTSPPLFFAT